MNDVYNSLIKLAALMVKGTNIPSSYITDHKWCKSTPIKEKRRIIKENEIAQEQCRSWAVKLREIAKLL